MHIAQGKHFIDGLDLWTNFKVIFRQGSNEAFLKMPKRKESLSHDWQDTNGIDVDTTKPFFEKRDITVNVAMVASSSPEFWRQYVNFASMFSQPGLRRLSVNELSRDYFVYYSDCTVFTKLRSIKSAGKLFFLFSLTLTEPNPTIVNTLSYIIDDEGRFMVT